MSDISKGAMGIVDRWVPAINSLGVVTFVTPRSARLQHAAQRSAGRLKTGEEP